MFSSYAQSKMWGKTRKESVKPDRCNHEVGRGLGGKSVPEKAVRGSKQGDETTTAGRVKDVYVNKLVKLGIALGKRIGGTAL